MLEEIKVKVSGTKEAVIISDTVVVTSTGVIPVSAALCVKGSTKRDVLSVGGIGEATEGGACTGLETVVEGCCPSVLGTWLCVIEALMENSSENSSEDMGKDRVIGATNVLVALAEKELSGEDDIFIARVVMVSTVEGAGEADARFDS